MALMLAKTYAAFKAAGVGEDQAQAAAEELAAFEARFGSMESSLQHMAIRLPQSMAKSPVSKAE